MSHELVDQASVLYQLYVGCHSRAHIQRSILLHWGEQVSGATGSMLLGLLPPSLLCQASERGRGPWEVGALGSPTL